GARWCGTRAHEAILQAAHRARRARTRHRDRTRQGGDHAMRKGERRLDSVAGVDEAARGDIESLPRENKRRKGAMVPLWVPLDALVAIVEPETLSQRNV